MCCYQTYPHIDNYERGQEAMRLVPRLLGGLRTHIHVERLPTLLPVAMCSTHPGFPAADMNVVCAEMEEKEGVIDCTVFHVSGSFLYRALLQSPSQKAMPSGVSVGRYLYHLHQRGRHDR